MGEVDRADDVHGLLGGRHLGHHRPQGGIGEEEHRQLRLLQHPILRRRRQVLHGESSLLPMLKSKEVHL